VGEALFGIPIKKVKFHPNYFDEKNIYQPKYDMILVELEEDQTDLLK
jgi:hypothetical protein